MTINLRSDIFAGNSNISNGDLVKLLTQVTRVGNRNAYSRLGDVVDTSASFTPYAVEDMVLDFSVVVSGSNPSAARANMANLLNPVSNNCSTLVSIINGMLGLHEDHVAGDLISDISTATPSATFTFAEPTLLTTNTAFAMNVNSSGSSMNVYLGNISYILTLCAYITNMLQFNSGEDSVYNLPIDDYDREFQVGSGHGEITATKPFAAAEEVAGVSTDLFDYEDINAQITSVVRTQLTLFAALKKIRNSASVTSINII